MITQLKYRLESDREERVPSHCAYRLYSTLLSEVPSQYANQLHDSVPSPISQYISFDPLKKENIWTVNLLTSESENVFRPVLHTTMEFTLPHNHIVASQISEISYNTVDEFSYSAYEEYDQNIIIEIPVPTAFKQRGKYISYPDEALIKQSLLRRINFFYPEIIMHDAPVRITGEKTKVEEYQLKGNRIPGFVGTIKIEKCDEETLPILLKFARFSGMGIKTALGMGGIL